MVRNQVSCRAYGEAIEGYEAPCPVCGKVCRCPYDEQGRLKWGPDSSKGHCSHFEGMYQGNGTEPVAYFRGTITL